MDLDVGASFSALINDVRIYSVAPDAEEIEVLAK